MSMKRNVKEDIRATSYHKIQINSFNNNNRKINYFQNINNNRNINNTTNINSSRYYKNNQNQINKNRFSSNIYTSENIKNRKEYPVKLKNSFNYNNQGNNLSLTSKSYIISESQKKIIKMILY